jgi:hypothetical protein
VRSSREVNFVISDLRFNFRPLRLASEQSLVLGFYTDEPKGALAEVEALPVPEGNADLLDVVLIVHEGDTHKLLRVLASDHDIHFALMNPASPEDRPILARPLMPLANFLLASGAKLPDPARCP